MKRMLVLFLCLGLVGCATASLMNRVSLGMTKDEAIKSIGRQPSTVKANSSDGTEILEYVLLTPANGLYEQYWVTLKNGKVTQFGRAGDFGSGRVGY